LSKNKPLRRLPVGSFASGEEDDILLKRGVNQQGKVFEIRGSNLEIWIYPLDLPLFSLPNSRQSLATKTKHL
jgi:hypothetical protein